MATIKHENEDGTVEIYIGAIIFRKDDYFRFAYRTVNGNNVEFDGWTDYWEIIEGG